MAPSGTPVPNRIIRLMRAGRFAALRPRIARMRLRRLASVLVAVLAADAVAPAFECSGAVRRRPPALAGSWYPGDRARLVAAAHLLMRLSAEAPDLPDRPVALVVPHAGWSYSGLAAAAAFRSLRPGDFDRVVVVAPSHHGSFRGFALDDAGSIARRSATSRSAPGRRPPCAAPLPGWPGKSPGRSTGSRSSCLSCRRRSGLLPRAGPRRRNGRGPRARVRGAACGARRRPDAVRLLLRLRPLRPPLRVPAFRGPLAAREGEDPRDGRAGRGAPRRPGRAGIPRLPGRHREHDLRPPRPGHPPRAAVARGATGPGRAPRPLRLVRPAGPTRTRAQSRTSRSPSCARPGPGRPWPAPRRAAAARGRSNRTRRRFSPRRDATSCASPAPPSPPTSSSATTWAASLAAWPAGPGREERRAVFVTLNRSDPEEARSMGRLRAAPVRPSRPFPFTTARSRRPWSGLRDSRFEPVTLRPLPARGRGHGAVAAGARRLVARHPPGHPRDRLAEGREGRASSRRWRRS